MKYATEQDVVDGTFLYVLRNIERGFDTVESSRSYLLIPRDIRNQYDFCTHADAVAVYAIWLGLTNASFSILYLLTPNYTRTRWRKLTKNVTSLSSVKLS
jgi:hypothetical protein